MSNHKSRQKQMEIEVKGLDNLIYERSTYVYYSPGQTINDSPWRARNSQPCPRRYSRTGKPLSKVHRVAPFVIAHLHQCSEISKLVDSAKFYQDVLKNGRSHKICTSCNRHLQESEMDAFEKHVSTFHACSP